MGKAMERYRDYERRIEKTNRALRMANAIDFLRSEEGDSVTVLCDNPEFDGPHNCIETGGAWTEWVDKRFCGDTLQEALEKACEARKAATPTVRMCQTDE